MVAAIIFLIAGYFKRIAFCDEVYTYTIANSDKTMVQFGSQIWYSHEELLDMVSHSENDSIRQVYVNGIGDSHPPMYYMLVHLVSCMFPGSTSKWIGLSVNCLMFLLVVAVMWLIINELSNSPFAAFMVTVVYALNAGTLSNAMLIRMYIQMTFFAILFIYFTVKLLNDPRVNRYYVCLGIATAGGFLTQYYFSFFAISFFICFAVWCIAKKEYKWILKYLVAMIAAVLFCTLVWRHWIPAVFDNPDSETIKGNALGITTIFSDWFKGIMVVQLSLFQKWNVIGAIFAAIVVIAFFANKKIRTEYDTLYVFNAMLVGAFLIYVGVVYKITPKYLLSTRYFYVASMMEVTAISVSVVGLCKAFGGKTAKLVGSFAVAIALIADMCILIFGNGIDYFGNGKEQDAQFEVLKEYAHIPWIVVGPEGWRIDMNFFDYTIPNRLCMITEESEYMKDEVLDNLDEFLIIAYDGDEKMSDKALYYYIGSTGKFAGSSLLMERNGLSYYVAKPISE